MLNEDQFQPRLFDPGPRRVEAVRSAEPEANVEEYTSAHSMEGGLWGDHAVDNPLHAQLKKYGGVALTSRNARVLRHELVPTWRIGSVQSRINAKAVEHQVEHADPWNLNSVPVMTALGNTFTVQDGNHRVNAALRRGQLFTEANVVRYETDEPSLAGGEVIDRYAGRKDTGAW